MNENTTYVDELENDEAIVTSEDETEAAEQPSTEPTDDLEIGDLVRDLVSALPEAVTPYQIHNVINTALDALGSDYQVRPQMMYNYDRNGLIVKGSKAVKRYAHEEVTAFATKFVTKHTA